jgi:hypothetical protein
MQGLGDGAEERQVAHLAREIEGVEVACHVLVHELGEEVREKRVLLSRELLDVLPDVGVAEVLHVVGDHADEIAQERDGRGPGGRAPRDGRGIRS